jgi:DNA-binding NtrC family response regulator
MTHSYSCKPIQMSCENILIVDDEAEIVNLLSRVLRRQGFGVFEDNTLNEGWGILEKVKPDVLFLDINLPDGNGLNKLTDIKASFPATKVIMISAFDMQEYRTKAQERGAYTFLSKPFNLTQVSDLIDKIKATGA